MRLFCTLAIILSLVISSHTINIASVNLSNRQPSEGCQLIIRNDEEVLDLRTDCKLLSSKQQVLPQWLQLIDLQRAYLLKNNNKTFLGYRYFKNKLHYKYVPQKLSLYENNLRAYLKSSQLQIPLPFEQRYTIILNLNQQLQKWSLKSLKVVYGFTHIQKIEIDEQKYHITHQYITQKSQIVSKNIATRKLVGKGLHQTISLKLQLTSQTNINIDSRICNITVKEILPESSYIDVDQLRSVQHYEVINIQKPEHFSKQYYYRYSFGLDRMKQVGVGKYIVEYPVHFRYPQPSTNNYTKVILHPSDSIVLSCLNSFSVNIPEDPFNDRGVALIFNGSSQDAKIVSMITFILMLLAIMLIARQLRKD